MKKILITGTAGFIGFHLVNRLTEENYDIYGLDNINDYYDVSLKYVRLEETGIDTTIINPDKSGRKERGIKKSEEHRNKEQGSIPISREAKSAESKDKISSFVQSSKFENYKFIRLDLCDKEGLAELFREQKFDFVIHLAAQAGVRYSLENPQAYIDSNITGFFNLLEACREYTPKHLIFASSSSVYGNNDKVPFSENDNTDHPVSLYAATKKSNEIMAHAYSSLYQIPITGLRFFTVYGPWGRPDMAYYSFAKNILEGKPIKVFAEGKLKRDFTYISDITESLFRIIDIIPSAGKSGVMFKIYNLGNDNPVEVNEFISLLEKYLGKEAIKEYLPMQKGDVIQTHAEISALSKVVKYKPIVNIDSGLSRFCDWFSDYQNI